jgi:hypothetical protein
MEGDTTFKSKVLQHFECLQENKQLETALQELIILTTGTTPQQGYSDYERERVMELLNLNTRLLNKIRKINSTIESYQR